MYLVAAKTEDAENDGVDGSWHAVAILDGHHTILLFGVETADSSSSSSTGSSSGIGRIIVTGSADGVVCSWNESKLDCRKKAKVPADKYGCIRDAVWDESSSCIAILTRRDAPQADYVLLVNPETLVIETALCSTSVYGVYGIHKAMDKTYISYELPGEGGILVSTLEILQRERRERESRSEAADIRNLVGSVVGTEQTQSRCEQSDIALSQDEKLLFYVHRGRRKLVTYETKNKTDRDAVYDKVVIDLDERSSTPCKGGVMWSDLDGGLVYLLSWFDSNQACLQSLNRSNRAGDGCLSVTRELEIDCDMQWEEDSTPWLLLDDFVLARSYCDAENSTFLELIEIEIPPSQGGNLVNFKPEVHSWIQRGESHERKENVSVEIVLRNCLGHTFVQALGYNNGVIKLLPWPLTKGTDKHCLRGHSRPITSLIEWQIVKAKNEVCKVLLSGCENGDVRVWSLDNLECMWTIPVCVSGISGFILPEKYLNYPWTDCFVATGKNGTVSFVSMNEKQKVRAFLGYPSTNELVSIAWNYKRNYIACLSISISRGPNACSQQFLCSITDVLSCRTERQVVGSCALQTFSEFLAIEDKWLSLLNINRGDCKSLNYSSISKSLDMSVITGDLHTMLEASSKQPDLQIALCMTMLAMHIHDIDDDVNLLLQGEMKNAIAAINKSELSDCSEAQKHALRLLPTLVGPDESFSVWLLDNSGGHGKKMRLPSQILAHMNLVVLSGLGWANAKSHISPEHFSLLNTFYGIRVPETITDAPMEAMHSYVEYIEHTNEHARDASNVLLNSTIANMPDKASAISSIQDELVKNTYGSKAWARNVLILGSIALSFDGDHDHALVVDALVNSVGQPDFPFHSSLVSLLTKGIASSRGGWEGVIEQSYPKLISSIVNAIHSVNGQVPMGLSPMKNIKAKSPFETLLSRDKLNQLLTMLMQKKILKFMNIFIEMLHTGAINSESSILPMVFTSILSLINVHPWSLLGATHQIVRTCFLCMHPSNHAMRKAYLHIGMSIICEMGLKLPFIDLNAS